MSERSLKGKTLFITGGSRGIGRAIALRAAQDGANVVIAAKTDTPHSKLEGTIHSVAAEIVKAGGQALACKVDLRNPEEVQAAIDATVAKFGGIDILVNNASAIQLTGTLETDVKRFDLMNQVNARGTWIASKLCMPHLLKAKNPHILTLSPPLSLDPIWFKPHCAYTMAKYGMSMTVLGLSHEFKEQGVSVNALWPLTTIATAAVNMLGGDSLMNVSRKEDIMCDSAWAILTRDSRKCTGNFFIDEDVMRAEGVTDFTKYSVVPGAKLALDFFVDQNRQAYISEQANNSGIKTSPTAASESSAASSSSGIKTSPTASTESSTASSSSGIKASPTASSEVQNAIGLLEESVAANNRFRRMACMVQYDVKENVRTSAESYTLDLTSSDVKFFKGKPPRKPDCVIGLSLEDLKALVQGRLPVREAFSSNRMTIRGNLNIAMQIHGSSGLAKL